MTIIFVFLLSLSSSCLTSFIFIYFLVSGAAVVAAAVVVGFRVFVRLALYKQNDHLFAGLSKYGRKLGQNMKTIRRANDELPSVNAGPSTHHLLEAYGCSLASLFLCQKYQKLD